MKNATKSKSIVKKTTKRAKPEAPIPFRPTLQPTRAQAPQPLLRADGYAMRGPGEGQGHSEEPRPLAEMAMERQLFTIPHRHHKDDARVPLGALLCEKLGNGCDLADGRGVAAGAMRTVLGGLELVRVIVAAQELDDVAGNAVDDLLQGLRELGQLAVEVEDRAIRAAEDAAAEGKRQASAREEEAAGMVQLAIDNGDPREVVEGLRAAKPPADGRHAWWSSLYRRLLEEHAARGPARCSSSRKAVAS